MWHLSLLHEQWSYHILFNPITLKNRSMTSLAGQNPSRPLTSFYEDYPLIATFPLQTGQSRAHRPDKALAGLWESSGHAGGNTLSKCKND